MTKSLRLWQWWLWFWAVWQYPGKATLSYCRFLWTVLFASLALTPSHSYQISLLSVWGQIWTRSKKTKRAKVFTKERCLLKEKRPTCSFTAQVSWTLLMQCAFVAKVSDFSAVSTFFAPSSNSLPPFYSLALSVWSWALAGELLRPSVYSSQATWEESVRHSPTEGSWLLQPAGIALEYRWSVWWLLVGPIGIISDKHFRWDWDWVYLFYF